MSTLTCKALTNITAMRNQESASPNLGTILAAEVYYLIIIPFSIVESALMMLALIFSWVALVPATILFPYAGSNLFSRAAAISRHTTEGISLAAISILWSLSSSVMNLLPVKSLETEQEAKNFFCCQEQEPPFEEPAQEPILYQRPVRTNAMSGFLAIDRRENRI